MKNVILTSNLGRSSAFKFIVLTLVGLVLIPNFELFVSKYLTFNWNNEEHTDFIFNAQKSISHLFSLIVGTISFLICFRLFSVLKIVNNIDAKITISGISIYFFTCIILVF